MATATAYDSEGTIIFSSSYDSVDDAVDAANRVHKDLLLTTPTYNRTVARYETGAVIIKFSANTEENLSDEALSKIFQFDQKH